MINDNIPGSRVVVFHLSVGVKKDVVGDAVDDAVDDVVEIFCTSSFVKSFPLT